jgi:endonuclease/exonuclease/phosphatase family metal-dependent hydrolase
MTPQRLSVASYNIHKGVGLDRRRDLARTMAVIGELDADILALQEADTRFGIRTGLLDLEHLHRDLGLVAVPLPVSGPAHGWHGNLLLLRNAEVEEVHTLALPGFEPRGAMLSDLRIKGRALRVVNTHLGLLPGSRNAQARALIDKLASLGARPTLLMGDLNEWRSQASMMRILQGFFTESPQVRSFPTRLPLLSLDRMMVCGQGHLRNLAAHDSPLARRASDHLPIKAELHLAGS